MKNILIILLIGSTLSVFADPAISEKKTAASIENAKSSIPSVDQILDKNIKAMGGKAAIEKITSRVMKGTLEIPAMGMTTSWEQQSKAPNKRFSSVEVLGMGKMQDGFDGVNGWSKNYQNTLEDKKGDELARIKRECVFNRELKFKEIYKQLTVKGKQKVDTFEAYVVEGQPTTGKNEQFLFDVQSGLLVGWNSSFENDAGLTEIKVVATNHREVDGVKLPHLLKMDLNLPNAQSLSLSVKIDQIRHNVPLEDSLFKKPSE